MKRKAADGNSKVYILAVLTVGLFAALFLLSEREAADWLAWANAVLTLYFVMCAAILLIAFLRQVRGNLYSYNTIFYAGFALFVLSLAATHGYASVLYFLNPGRFDNRQMLFTLLHSAKNYMFLTTPFLILFSAALFVSNLSLIRHEGRRFVNILGILFSVLLMVGELGIGILDFLTAESDRVLLAPIIMVNLFAAMYLYFECMMIGTIIANFFALRCTPDLDREYLIVLGCGIRADGTPTPLLKGRLDRALDFYHKQLRETSKAANFVVSGGQGPDEVQTEAASMREYLLAQGIPEEQILVEDRSADTTENMRYSAELILPRDPEAKVAYFTTNYHVFRAGIKARQAKLRAVGVGAVTKWYFWPNAAVREFLGLLTEHRVSQGLILLSMIAVYTALSILALQ